MRRVVAAVVETIVVVAEFALDVVRSEIQRGLVKQHEGFVRQRIEYENLCEERLRTREAE